MMNALKDLVNNTHMDLVDIGTGSAATLDDMDLLYNYGKHVTVIQHLRMLNELTESAFINTKKN